MQDYEKAAKLRDEYLKIRTNVDAEKQNWRNETNQKIITIGADEIAEVVSRWTGIPVAKINQHEYDKLRNLENILSKRVVGQKEAIIAVSKAIRRSRVGLKDPNRPIGSFLFLGATGVGKTELSKALAESMFGSENHIIRLDMSEYMEGHSVSKMIGSPPGYVGYGESGFLTEKVRKNPYSVVLFDEIEKAHPDVLNILLQILEDGNLTDNQGKKIDFKNSVIIMTSNIGARLITEQKQIGFENISSNDDYKKTRLEVLKETRKTFKPEFLNRIDEMIVFHKLSENDLKKIADLLIEKVIKKAKKQGIELEVTSNARKIIVQKGTDEKYGARPLRRTIQNLVEDTLAEKILENTDSENRKFIFDEKDGKLEVRNG